MLPLSAIEIAGSPKIKCDIPCRSPTLLIAYIAISTLSEAGTFGSDRYSLPQKY